MPAGRLNIGQVGHRALLLAAAMALVPAGGGTSGSNYTELNHTNCWTGHGGVNIDHGPVASTFTVPSCEARCDATPGCHCVVMFANASATNGVLSGCWRRTACVPAKCMATGAFNTFLKPGSPPAAAAPATTAAASASASSAAKSAAQRRRRVRCRARLPPLRAVQRRALRVRPGVDWKPLRPPPPAARSAALRLPNRPSDVRPAFQCQLHMGRR
eukprot:COSAG02_NODE_2752_length_8098_cov_1.961495_1_plen_214_part_10